MTETATELGREQRLAERVEQLYANDPQFRAAAPSAEVTDAAHRPGLRLSEVVDTYVDGYADRPALGQRACEVSRDESTGSASATLLSGFETITYRELGDRVSALASAWQSGVPGGFRPGDFVAVLGFTSIDYVVNYLACIRLGAVFVPLQTSSSAAQLSPIVGETAPRVFAVSIESLDTAVDVLIDAPSVERLVVFDYTSDDDGQRDRYDYASARLGAAGRRVEMVPLVAELESGRGLAAAPAFVPSAGENPLATLIYTSGSTGAPKGAMYTTDMMTRIWQRPHSPSVDIGRQIPAIHLQYMPLSHVYGLEWLIATLASGGIGYFAAKSDMSTLFDDIGLVRPTALNLVPRVCDMFFRRYRKELDQRSPGDLSAEQLDEMVKTELREDFIGGRVLSAMCGSAPLSRQMHAFMESLLDVAVADGYGATETGGGILRNGMLKRPPVTDYKLVDVPELGYLTTDKPYPRGELYLKASTIIPGYFKHPELSAQIFDDDGFYKTGDIMAELGPDHLMYLDRSNNVIKLSQGEFVAVSQLEATFSTSPYIRQVFLYGSSEQPFLLAVIVPNADAIGDRDARALIADSLQRIAADARLNPYEIPRDFLLESERFTRDNGLLSGVGKLLRPALKARYGERLDAMYADIEASQSDQLTELRAASRELPTIETVRRAAAATLGLSSDSALGADAKFIDLGGDSLSAFSFATLLEGIFGIDLPVQTIVSPTATLATIANYIDGERTSVSTRPTFASVHGRGATIARAADLTLDKFVDADTLAAARGLPRPTGTVNTVLLTGANGYLGRFLCLDWLERLAPTGGKVICLARGADPTAGRQRIEAAIDSGDPELSARFRELADRHLQVLVGDVGAANLGLDTATYDRLARSVDLIVHSAALVNHVLPYSQLFGPNVVGTAEIIKLAITKRLKPINYISTVAVTALPDGGFIGEDVDVRSASPSRSLDESYASGYATSKWAGEVLLREAHDLCELPVAVFRSDMILAHSHFSGQLNVPDMFTRLILSVVATGIAPRSFYRLDASGNPQRAHYDGLPADFTAEAITTLGGSISAGYRTYNVLNTHDDGVSLDTFVDWLVAAGHRIERIDDYGDWLTRFEAAMKSLPDNQRKNSMLPLMSAYARPGQPTQGTQMPAEKFRAAVQSAGIGAALDVPHVTEALIDKYVSDLERLGLLRPRAAAAPAG
ncbi:carboxylic acid reductase [Mycobacterium sp. 852002-51057_SCH5723018]|uniref:carboxylic acid reductase n=1 Tax=Mycobacterium sp. 852002-51057_SCH5723018 TaxID=1834094 RepID=UPI000801E111|nr:carboxylic acid reductase [Mycobacterium sp. 852002-51057_SCH5723018]OBG23289.1 oxidoreductase [Mycobacterium sp. 852002-51057_SCH5723018]